jgi:DivIVA domain-containing protein
VSLLIVLVVLAVLGAIALVAAGRGDALPEPFPDHTPLGLPESGLQADDLGGLRFAVGFRGYRMDQVDLVLDRVAAELAERDARIAELEALREADAPVDEG